MKNKIYFRADAGTNIGYGHFIRTLALADMLKGEFNCTFCTVAPTSYQMSEMGKVCNYIALNADTHFEDFLSWLEGDEIVVLDNYFFSTDYQREIKRKGCRLVCIDDMYDKHYVADIVINHAITNSELFSIEPYTQLCLGYSWALLRKSFFEKSALIKKQSKKISSVVICFGGSDYLNLTGYFVEYLLENESITRIIAVVGDKYDVELQLLSPKVTYFHNLSAENMADIFYSSDLAILSASTVCLEALSCHTLVAAGYYVDNQAKVYEEYASRNMILPLGNLRNFDIVNFSIQSIISSKSKCLFVNDFVNISERYLSLFCTLLRKGNHSVGDFLFVDYRNMDEKQIGDIWQIRNEDSIRCWMENSDVISWESHLQFISYLSSSHRKVYWGVYYQSTLVGSVNIDFYSSKEVDRGIFLAPAFLDQSFGGAIEKALNEILISMGVSMMTAKVLRSNVRSLRFHLKNGYILKTSDEKYDYLTKKQ